MCYVEELNIYIYIYIYTHTHTHRHTFICVRVWKLTLHSDNLVSLAFSVLMSTSFWQCKKFICCRFDIASMSTTACCEIQFLTALPLPFTQITACARCCNKCIYKLTVLSPRTDVCMCMNFFFLSPTENPESQPTSYKLYCFVYQKELLSRANFRLWVRKLAWNCVSSMKLECCFNLLLCWIYTFSYAKIEFPLFDIQRLI